MQLLIVGLGSMGKRRARLLRGIAPDAVLCGVDANAARRAEAEGLGIPAYDSIGAAVAARAFDAALVCTAPLSHAAVIGALLDAGLCAMVNSDDPAYFGGYMNQNFVELFNAQPQLTARHAYQLALNSFEASFVDADQKRAWQHRLDAVFAAG